MRKKLIITVLLSSIISLTAFSQECEAWFFSTQDSFNHLTFSFTDGSIPQENIIDWNWDFGDGNTSNEFSPTHTYQTDGEYLVVLSVFTTDNSSTFNQLVSTSIVVEDCLADFYYFSNNPAGLEITFEHFPEENQIINSHFWDFGDGATSDEAVPTHSYPGPGIYEVIHTIMGNSCQGTSTDLIYVGEDYYYGDECVAMYSFAQLDPAGQSFQFYDASWVPGGTANFFLWDFGDGNTSNLQNPLHTFSDIGIFDISLTIGTDDCQNTYITTIYTGENTWYPQACQPLFWFETSTENHLNYQFHDFSASTEPIFDWYWDFGDGNFSTLQNPEHTFSSSGNYEVSLTAFGPNCENTFTLNIQTDETVVNQDSIIPLFYPEIIGNMVYFHNLTLGDAQWYHWDFGDGTTSTDFEPIRSFDELGIHEVALSSGKSQRTRSIEENIPYNTITILFETEASTRSITSQPTTGFFYPRGLPLESKSLSINEFNISPNPAHHNIVVKTAQKAETVEIFNISGNIVYRKKISQAGNINIDISQLPLGVYVIRTNYSNGETVNKKFIRK